MVDKEKETPVPEEMDFEETEALLKYSVSPSDINAYDKKLQVQMGNGAVDNGTKFRYAWCLVHSASQKDMKLAVPLLEELFRNGNEQMKRDSLFYLAVVHTKLKDYCIAKKHITSFLSVEPLNSQAKQLLAYIELHLRKDGIAGMAILGGAAIVGGVAAIAVGGIVLASGAAMAAIKAVRDRRR